MSPVLRAVACGLALGVIGGCSDSSDSPPPGPYADDALWLCKPGIADDKCLALDQDATWILEDNSQVFYEHEVAVYPDFDCFYVYPTQDFTEGPGNSTDIINDDRPLRPLYNQAARFNSLCNVFAPRYRQMTFDTFELEDWPESEFFDVAYGDVEEAFDQYLRENRGRNFVLMGHSQGSFMLIELLARRIDNDDALRSRMISALIIGPYGSLANPPGVFGSDQPYQNIDLCTRAGDTGCIVAYNSIADGVEPSIGPTEGETWPCVDPTLLGGNPGVLDNFYLNEDEGIPFPPGVETDWIAYPGVYSGRCTEGGQLAIGVVEGRTAPVPPQLAQLVFGGTLHLVDFNLLMGDLLRIVEAQADNMP